MKPERVNTRLITLSSLAACLALALIAGNLDTASTQSPKAARKLDVRAHAGMPVRVREVRNLQKGEDWLRDLEVEVRNVSDKPVYLMEVSIHFPNVPAPTPTPHPETGYIPRAVTGFGIAYGAYRLIDVRELAGADDVPLKPGETYVFKVPEPLVVGFEYMKKEKKNLPPKVWNKVELWLHIVNFGDGTGYAGGRKVSYSKEVGAKPAGRKTAPPFVSKVNQSRPALVVGRFPRGGSVRRRPGRESRRHGSHVTASVPPHF